VHRKYIPIYIQQDAKLHSLFISENCSTCFGWYFHPSSVANTTVSTASGICHTVTAICRYRGRDGTGLRVLHPQHSVVLAGKWLLLTAANKTSVFKLASTFRFGAKIVQINAKVDVKI
jgi:hypothetical protein